MSKIHHKIQLKIAGEDYRFNIEDIALYHILRIRQQKEGYFPSFHNIGKFRGEGQSGGRMCYEIARDVEKLLVEQMGEDKYQRQCDEYIQKYIAKNNLDWKKVAK